RRYSNARLSSSAASLWPWYRPDPMARSQAAIATLPDSSRQVCTSSETVGADTRAAAIDTAPINAAPQSSQIERDRVILSMCHSPDRKPLRRFVAPAAREVRIRAETDPSRGGTGPAPCASRAEMET